MSEGSNPTEIFIADTVALHQFKINFFLNTQTRMDHQPTDSILDWSGYIDQGKQLSILHSLLVENFPKLPPQKQNEMAQLTAILERISQIKESTENNYQRHLMEPNFASMEKLNGHKSSLSSLQTSNPPTGERGIMRGVLTPNSLQKNIVSWRFVKKIFIKQRQRFESLFA